MQQIRHMSFDVWNTLITSNPMFVGYRTEMLADFFEVSVEEAAATYTKVKRDIDRDAETVGIGYTNDHCLSILAQNFGKPVDHDMSEIKAGLHYLFQCNPPQVLPGMKAVLSDVVEKGYTISIASNSNFVAGEWMKAWIDTWHLPFQYFVFSDQEETAKPHPAFFEEVIRKASLMDRPATPDQIVHIGDHLICDLQGARNAGIHAQHIMNPVHLITLLEKV